MSVAGVTADLAKMRVIAERDWRIFSSYRLQMMMRVLSGASVVVGLFFMGRLVATSAELGAYRGRYFEFALVGVVFLAFVNVGLRTFSGTISGEQRSGTLEVLLATPVRLPTLLAGLYAFPLATMAINMAVYLATALLLLDARFEVAGLPAAAALLGLTLLIFGAVGAISAAVIIVTKRGDPVAALVAQAVMLLGGAVFPVTVMPEWLVTIAKLLPLGLWLFSRALRQARVMGTLGSY